MDGQADLVVLLSHQGAPADIMLGGVLSGVHIIIGGHTHSILAEPIIIRRPGGSPEKTYIVQAGENYRYLGRVDLTFTRSEDEPWQVADISSQLIPISEPVAADAKIAKRLAEYKHSLTEVVYQAREAIPAHGPGENTVANLALKAIGQEFPGSVIALDRGAIRSKIALPKATSPSPISLASIPGEIRYSKQPSAALNWAKCWLSLACSSPA